MVQRLRLHLLPVPARASHFHLRPGSAILQLVVPLVTVKADSPAVFPRLARETGSRPVVAAVVFAARSSPDFARFAFVPCLGGICFGIADSVIVAADPFSLGRFGLAAVVGSVGFAAGSAVAAVVGSAGFAAGSVVVVVAAAAAAGPSVAVDSAAIVFAVVDPGSAVAADLVCFSGSVCSFAVEMGKGRAVVVISCFLTPRSSF